MEAHYKREDEKFVTRKSIESSEFSIESHPSAINDRTITDKTIMSKNKALTAELVDYRKKVKLLEDEVITEYLFLT